MNQFKAKSVSDTQIVLETKKDIEKLYQAVTNGEDFILSWKENGKEKSNLIVASDLTSKIRNKEIELSAEEVVKND